MLAQANRREACIQVLAEAENAQKQDQLLLQQVYLLTVIELLNVWFSYVVILFDFNAYSNNCLNKYFQNITDLFY